jgi:hypothetical protein
MTFVINIACQTNDDKKTEVKKYPNVCDYIHNQKLWQPCIEVIVLVEMPRVPIIFNTDKYCQQLNLRSHTVESLYAIYFNDL